MSGDRASVVRAAGRAALVIVCAMIGGASAPMTFMSAYGRKASTVLPLTWAVTAISLAVIVIILGLVVAGAWRNGATLAREAIPRLPIGHTDSGLAWIYVGVGISTVVLLVILVWTMWVLAKIYLPPARPAVTVLITAHQWWWEAKYIGRSPSETFTTANEIHIPTGVPVMFKLTSADVIHSFWVPLLNGKTDTIPGQTNVTWLDASRPGIYRGQCTEYCGLQHAKMALYVIAQTPADFQRWWKKQLQPAPPITTATAQTNQNAFILRCGACHTVRGTDAGGIVGPDLSHLMNRHTIAAGTIANTPGNLSAWIANPQGIKPGSLMPTLGISGRELNEIRSYLVTLR